jgi:hypothetical protein
MTENDQKAQSIIESAFPNLWMLKEAMDDVGILDVDLLRALYLVGNVKKVSKWGKVTISVKDGEIVSVTGENNFISQGELKRNLNKYQNR